MFKKNYQAINDTVIRDIQNRFELEEDYYKRVRVGDFCSDKHIEYESKGYQNKSTINQRIPWRN